jgi:hypothetical protein
MMAVFIRIAAAFLLALLQATTGLTAQTPRDDVAVQLKVVTEARAEDGFVPDQEAIGRSTILGVLEHEATVYLELTLDARRQYHIAARCDTGCSNIDTRVLGTDFGPVAEDTLDNDAPKMDLSRVESGRHLLAVRMANCAAGICYFGVVVLSRPQP